MSKNAKTGKIVLKKNKEINKIWHAESGLVFKSARDRKVIGRYEDGEIIPLDDRTLELCIEWKFKYDEDLVEEVESGEESVEETPDKKDNKNKVKEEDLEEEEVEEEEGEEEDEEVDGEEEEVEEDEEEVEEEEAVEDEENNAGEEVEDEENNAGEEVEDEEVEEEEVEEVQEEAKDNGTKGKKEKTETKETETKESEKNFTDAESSNNSEDDMEDGEISQWDELVSHRLPKIVSKLLSPYVQELKNDNEKLRKSLKKNKQLLSSTQDELKKFKTKFESIKSLFS